MIELWKAILAYADSVGATEGEGNSGEFHNPKDAAQNEKQLARDLKKLRLEFQKVTGFLPVWKLYDPRYDKRSKGTEEEGWLGFWYFEK